MLGTVVIVINDTVAVGVGESLVVFWVGFFFRLVLTGLVFRSGFLFLFGGVCFRLTFVTGEEKIVDFIKHYGRSILFSASLPPASVAAAQAALTILKREPERVDRVNANGHYLREDLKSLGFDVGVSQTPIVPIMVGDDLLTLTLWRELLDMGIYVNSVLYPAVPRDAALLRTSVTSEHTREHLDRALETLVRLKKKHKW